MGFWDFRMGAPEALRRVSWALLSHRDPVALGKQLLSLSASSGNAEPNTQHPLSGGEGRRRWEIAKLDP